MILLKKIIATSILSLSLFGGTLNLATGAYEEAPTCTNGIFNSVKGVCETMISCADGGTISADGTCVSEPTGGLIDVYKLNVKKDNSCLNNFYEYANKINTVENWFDKITEYEYVVKIATTVKDSIIDNSYSVPATATCANGYTLGGLTEDGEQCEKEISSSMCPSGQTYNNTLKKCEGWSNGTSSSTPKVIRDYAAKVNSITYNYSAPNYQLQYTKSICNGWSAGGDNDATYCISSYWTPWTDSPEYYVKQNGFEGFGAEKIRIVNGVFQYTRYVCTAWGGGDTTYCEAASWTPWTNAPEYYVKYGAEKIRIVNGIIQYTKYVCTAWGGGDTTYCEAASWTPWTNAPEYYVKQNGFEGYGGEKIRVLASCSVGTLSGNTCVQTISNLVCPAGYSDGGSNCFKDMNYTSYNYSCPTNYTASNVGGTTYTDPNTTTQNPELANPANSSTPPTNNCYTNSTISCGNGGINTPVDATTDMCMYTPTFSCATGTLDGISCKITDLACAIGYEMLNGECVKQVWECPTGYTDNSDNLCTKEVTKCPDNSTEVASGIKDCKETIPAHCPTGYTEDPTNPSKCKKLAFNPNCKMSATCIQEKTLCPAGSKTQKIYTDGNGIKQFCNQTNIANCPVGTTEICVSNKTPFCEKNTQYNVKTGKCEAEGKCDIGYKMKDGKCYKEYTYSAYQCETGWQGPLEAGNDCLGICGEYGCQCNGTASPANNCKKPESEIANAITIYKKRELEEHTITGNGLSEKDFGTYKGFSCGENCLFYLNKITTDNGNLCFEKKNKEKECVTVKGCSFDGEITNNVYPNDIEELNISNQFEISYGGINKIPVISTYYTCNVGTFDLNSRSCKQTNLDACDTGFTYNSTTKKCTNGTEEKAIKCNFDEIVENGKCVKYTTPGCGATGFKWDQTTGKCLKIEQEEIKKIKSTCKMNGHVGGATYKGGISSIKIDPNNKGKLIFWDSYLDKDIGFIEFVKDVKEEDRKEDFVPENLFLYEMLSKGFTAIDTLNGNTFFSSAYDYTEAECTTLANSTGTTKAVETAEAKALLKKLSGDRTSTKYEQPLCPGGLYIASLSSCIKDQKEATCVNGKYDIINAPAESYLIKNNAIWDNSQGDNIEISAGLTILNTGVYKINIGTLGDAQIFIDDSLVAYVAFSSTKETIVPFPLTAGVHTIKVIAKKNILPAALNPDQTIKYGLRGVAVEIRDTNDIIVSSSRNWCKTTAGTCPAGTIKYGNTCLETTVPYCKNGAVDYSMNGLCKIETRCVVTKFNAGSFNSQTNSIKKETRDAPMTLKCSPLTCSGSQCKTATCETGYSGTLLPTPAAPGECTDNKCDGFKPYKPICGKDGGCDKSNPLIIEEGGICKEAYCPSGYRLDTVNKVCQKLGCPEGTITQPNGSCLTK